MKLDKIYVLHHTPLKSRKDVLEKKFQTENIEVEWVELFLPNDITSDYEEYLENHEIFVSMKIKHAYGEYENFSKKISIGELSLYLKHEWCINDQINNNYNNILILEDDCDLPNNFKEHLNNYLNDFDGEILMVGKSHNFTSKNQTYGKSIHYGDNQLTRCAHAIVYNLDASKKISKQLKHRNMPFDLKLNEIFILNEFKVAWAEPGILQNFNMNQNSINRI